MRTKRRIKPQATAELRILPEGRVLANNLTPALAGVLAGLNPVDAVLRQRAGRVIRSGMTSKNMSRVRNTVAKPKRGSPPATGLGPRTTDL